MRTRPLLILVGLVTIQWAFPACGRSDEEMTHRFVCGASSVGIPFELNSNKIYLSVKIDDGPLRSFILDSGCPVTAVDMTLARSLDLPIASRGQVGGAGEGRTNFGTTRIKSLTLQGLEVVPKTVWALDVNKSVSSFEGRRIDGLLGLDFLQQFVVRIDYPNRKLDVLPPKDFKPIDGGIEVPLEATGNHYAVRGKLNLKSGETFNGKFIVDVGVRLPLLVNTPFVNRNRLIEKTEAGPLQTVGGGLGGESKGHIGRIESLSIGTLKIAAPFVALSQEKRSAQASDQTQGILGAEVFRRYCMTWDLPRQRIIFNETSESKSPYEFDMSGMFLIAQGDDLQQITVLSVVVDGPAAVAGIQTGDVLVELDGKVAAKLTLEQVRAAFREHGATRELTLKRQDRRVNVKLPLRRLN